MTGPFDATAATGGTGATDPTDPADARLARRARGRLAEANRAGLLAAIDVHTAARLGALAGEDDEDVLLALALLVRAARDGSTALDLAAAGHVIDHATDHASLGAGFWPEPRRWARAVAASPLSAAGVLRTEFGLTYLDRYHEEEAQVSGDLAARLGREPPVVDESRLATGARRVFPGEGYDEQRAAAAAAARQWTTVLTGGPGTGKTTTVAGVLALLAEQAHAAGGRLRVALCAPTGKAAARLQEAVAQASEALPQADRDRLGRLDAATVHRLLGWAPGGRGRFRHHRGNTLPHDVVVVDEASMLSLTMTARLLQAVRSDTRLLLVGDPDQLASVDAGAVLSDLVAGLAAHPAAPVVRLTTSHRFSAAIGTLAAAVRDGDADAALAALADRPDIELLTGDAAHVLRPRLAPRASALRDAARAGDAERALGLLAAHRLLCAHRRGPAGVAAWNRHVETWLVAETGERLEPGMYPGRPLLVTANDSGLRLFNGDTGVVVRGADGATTAVMAAVGDRVRLAASRLSDVETMHAMTVHKSQGSEADDVTVLLPADDSALLTRELLFTAVTRARRHVTLVGDEARLRAAIGTPARRATGLSARLRRDAFGGAH